MKNHTKPWPIVTICAEKNFIELNPDYQRPAVWSRNQKQLLIDSILRGIRYPEIVFSRS